MDFDKLKVWNINKMVFIIAEVNQNDTIETLIIAFEDKKV